LLLIQFIIHKTNRALVSALKCEDDPLRRIVAAEATADLITLLVDPESRWAEYEKKTHGLDCRTSIDSEASAVLAAGDITPATAAAVPAADAVASYNDMRHKWTIAATKLLSNLCGFVGTADSAAAPYRRVGARAALQALAARKAGPEADARYRNYNEADVRCRSANEKKGGDIAQGVTFFATFPSVASRIMDGLGFAQGGSAGGGLFASTAPPPEPTMSGGASANDTVTPKPLPSPQATLTALHLVALLASCLPKQDQAQLSLLAPTIGKERAYILVVVVGSSYRLK